MDARAHHLDVVLSQLAKRHGAVCGDVVECRRATTHATVVLADGIGSGPRANVAAHLCVARLLGLLTGGRSLRDGFATLVRSMEGIRDVHEPYAAFSVLSLQPNGTATVLTYETPPALHLASGLASPLRCQQAQIGQGLVRESHCTLAPGDGVLLVSDGVTQAGIGHGLPLGWGDDGLLRFVNDSLAHGVATSALPDTIVTRANEHWQRRPGDDCTALVGSARVGQVVTVLTGPPVNRQQDAVAVTKLLEAPAPRVVCGGTTAALVARHLGQKVEILEEESPVAPPRYRIDGIDLVTEGAVTLNQAFNILFADPPLARVDDGPARLGQLLEAADTVHFLVGSAPSLAGEDPWFRRQGILRRRDIVRLLGERLEAAGKLVVIESVG